ncbi:HAD family phosphatase [Candidatus Woesearchaeota archaeon]|nr:HAD family phosphatase [Candidatus Woesearchaeota archaeon]
MIKAVIFDVDGVLYDSEGVAFESTRRIFLEKGIHLRKKEMLPFLGSGAEAYVRGGMKLHGVHLDVKKALEKKKEHYLSLLKKIKIFPGVHELLNKLKNKKNYNKMIKKTKLRKIDTEIKKVKLKKIKLAIATSGTPEKLFPTLRHVHIDKKIFDVIVTGNQVKTHKPHPGIYLKTAELLKVKPAECVVIEDSANGVMSAKRAGMICIAVTNSLPRKKLLHAGADKIVKNLREVEL